VTIAVRAGMTEITVEVVEETTTAEETRIEADVISVTIGEDKEKVIADVPRPQAVDDENQDHHQFVEGPDPALRRNQELKALGILG
jgi:hypothetical protein